MSNAVFLDQSAQSLQLTLLADLDINQFLVLAHECRTFAGDIAVEAAIIGASHCLRYSLGNWQLWEVFACTPVQGRQLAFLGPIEIAQGRFSLDAQPHAYSFEAQTVSWQEGHQRAERLKRAVQHPIENQIQLSYVFPMGPLEDAPCTIVRVEQIQNKVCVETMHSYPNEGQVVFTSSQVIGSKSP